MYQPDPNNGLNILCRRCLDFHRRGRHRLIPIWAHLIFTTC